MKIRLSLYEDTSPMLPEVSVLATANRKLQDATADTSIALVIRLARMNAGRHNTAFKGPAALAANASRPAVLNGVIDDQSLQAPPSA